ncbi:MAG: lytic transglycosylase domain-containing protein [Bdellovibrionaceae bacterium]|nr:lytic transglycosylase domain-containing protein [Bdellovibrio sp.]
MRTEKKILITGLLIFFSQSCQSKLIKPATGSHEAALAPAAVTSPAARITSSNPSMIEMSCDQLIEKAGDAKFSLKGLAGIRAHKNCKNFKYDFKELSEIEKRIYAEEIEELDLTKPSPLAKLTITELKKNLKSAVTAIEKMKAYRQLRSKQKSAGLRNDFLKSTADLFNWAKAELKKIKKDQEAAQRFYEAAQLFARTYWTEGRLQQADQILTETLRDLKNLTSVAEIYFIQGRMAEEVGDFDTAVSYYDLCLEDMKKWSPKNLSFTADRIQWLKSWILYKNRRWTEAEKSFAALAASTVENSERSRASFYQARTLKELDKKEESKKILEKLTQDDFFGYYGLVSYHELGKKIPALSKLKYEKKFPFDKELSFLGASEKNIFQDLIRYQEVDLAERAVPILSKGLEKQINLSIYLAENGQRFLPLFASFTKLSNETKIEVFMKHMDLIFPQPYLDQVKIMSAKTNIPTSLIYSIIKQESAFNSKTRSHADAMGLMQMIPRLAKQLSKKFEVPYAKPEDLYNPEINIQLGTYELMEQVRKQDGQLTFVAAAYNAGPRALSGWLKTKKFDDTLEFIEDIPYEETRTYVKIIARNKLFYERISKRDDEHDFPIEFLKLNVAKQDESVTSLTEPKQ